MIVFLIIVGIININKISYIEAESSSYTRTTFDYYISSPSEDQVDEIKNYKSVDKIFPCFALNNAFAQNNKTKEIFLLLSKDFKDYDISIFNDKTLIKGKFDENGIMLDELAAQKLGVKVGDEIKFSILGKTYRKTVSAIYLKSTYGTLTTGLALAKFSDEISQSYKPKAYGFAFIKSNDNEGLEYDLMNYAGEGNVPLTYDEFVTVRCGTKPFDKTQEQFDQECLEKYNAYKDEILAAARRGGNQVSAKEDSYILIKDKLYTTQKEVDTLNIITAIASFVVFTLVNIIFIFARKSDDKILMLEGKSANNLFINHSLTIVIIGLLIFIISFVSLLIAALNTHFLSTIIKSILVMTIPTIASILVLIIFDFIYVKVLYSNNSK